MPQARHALLPLLLALAVPIASSALAKTPGRMIYSLDAQASGVIETINNIANLTVVSKDANDLKAEYRAGFVQGKLQAKGILAARDNTWDNRLPDGSRPRLSQAARPHARRIGQGRAFAERQLWRLLQYMKNPVHRPRCRAAAETAAVPAWSASIMAQRSRNPPPWISPEPGYRMQPTSKKAELDLGYETPNLTFMDVYYVNAVQ